MEELLTEFELEFNETKNIVMTLDNAIMYCMESGIDTQHLYVVSNYICERMDNLSENIESLSAEYYERHVK